jgi:hypothetical protein
MEAVAVLKQHLRAEHPPGTARAFTTTMLILFGLPEREAQYLFSEEMMVIEMTTASPGLMLQRQT